MSESSFDDANDTVFNFSPTTIQMEKVQLSSSKNTPVKTPLNRSQSSSNDPNNSEFIYSPIQLNRLQIESPPAQQEIEGNQETPTEMPNTQQQTKQYIPISDVPFHKNYEETQQYVVLQAQPTQIISNNEGEEERQEQIQQHESQPNIDQQPDQVGHEQEQPLIPVVYYLKQLPETNDVS